MHAAERDDMDARRFQREAKIGASLSHPNLVSIFDTEQDDESVLLVMEYVDGETLADVLARGRGRAEPRRRNRAGGRRGARPRAQRAASSTATSSPANVLLGRDGR